MKSITSLRLVHGFPQIPLSSALIKHASFCLCLTLSVRMARTVYQEKPSIFSCGTSGVTCLKIRFLWKMYWQYGIFFNESKIDRIRHNIQKTGS